MSMYYIKTGLEYWKPKGYGYTKNREEAGVFTLKDMEKLNLDGCTLERAELTSSPTFALCVSGGGFPLLGDSCSRSTWFLLHRAA